MIQSWDDRASLHITFSFFNAAFKAGKNKSFFVPIDLLLVFYSDKSQFDFPYSYFFTKPIILETNFLSY